MPRFEVEQKYRIKNPASLRQRLKSLGAKCLQRGLEKNELWDWEGMFRKRGCVLRLRETGGRGVLTLKGPKLKSKFKKRREWENEVNLKIMRAILKGGKFKVIARYHKIREEYLLRGAHVTLDHLSKHGWFSEIEAPSEKIAILARALGFTEGDREERTYLEMIYGPKSTWRGK